MKTCTKCGETKREDRFSHDGTKLRSHCKACVRDYHRRYSKRRLLHGGPLGQRSSPWPPDPLNRVFCEWLRAAA